MSAVLALLSAPFVIFAVVLIACTVTGVALIERDQRRSWDQLGRRIRER